MQTPLSMPAVVLNWVQTAPFHCKTWYPLHPYKLLTAACEAMQPLY